jgi:hypothetical protein
LKSVLELAGCPFVLFGRQFIEIAASSCIATPDIQDEHASSSNHCSFQSGRADPR